MQGYKRIQASKGSITWKSVVHLGCFRILALHSGLDLRSVVSGVALSSHIATTYGLSHTGLGICAWASQLLRLPWLLWVLSFW